MQKFIAKKHISHDNKIIISICDKEILDKKFEDELCQLDLSSEFYKGTEFNEDELIDFIKDANILNIVGDNSINFALKHNIIKKENIKHIKKIPFAQPYYRN